MSDSLYVTEQFKALEALQIQQNQTEPNIIN